jgi:prolipoprotein diacylglyceryltransferase
MLPHLPLPLGRGLGVALLAVAAIGWALLRRRDVDARARFAPLLLLIPGIFLLAAGHVRTVQLPTYGMCMLAGTTVALLLAGRWAAQRGYSHELVVELAIVGLALGIAGARLVFIIEQWDTMFADKAPGRLSPGPREPLTARDELRLRTHAGDVTVRFRGDEADVPAIARRIEEQAGKIDVEAQVRERQHRGARGVETVVRGFMLRTRRRGPDALLEVAPGPTADKLGLQPGTSQGKDVPALLKAFDLREGGLTYFGSAIGVTLGWLWWLRRRRVSILGVLDAIFPVLPLGLFFGRLGCLARSCCWGREAGEGALLTVSYPPWSLPWLQMVEERLPVDFDRALHDQTMTPRMVELLAPTGLLEGTPPMHAAQLYEGFGVLIITALLVLFRARLQTRVGQVVLLTFLLQAPLRFVVEHYRRDLDVFAHGGAYSFTESQVVAMGFVVIALPLFVWVSLRGEPVAEAARP